MQEVTKVLAGRQKSRWTDCKVNENTNPEGFKSYLLKEGIDYKVGEMGTTKASAAQWAKNQTPRLRAITEQYLEGEVVKGFYVAFVKSAVKADNAEDAVAETQEEVVAK